jgi:hypothetical protein
MVMKDVIPVSRQLWLKYQETFCLPRVSFCSDFHIKRISAIKERFQNFGISVGANTVSSFFLFKLFRVRGIP